MTLSDLGNLGEFLGSIAVIISLVYLAIQIRANTRLLVRSEINQAVSQNASLRMAIGSSSEFATLIVKGRRSLENLDEVARLRFDCYMEHQMYLALNDWARETSGVWEPGTWRQIYSSKLGELLEQEGARGWWQQNNGRFREAFREAVDSLRAR